MEATHWGRPARVRGDQVDARQQGGIKWPGTRGSDRRVPWIQLSRVEARASPPPATAWSLGKLSGGRKLTEPQGWGKRHPSRWPPCFNPQLRLRSGLAGGLSSGVKNHLHLIHPAGQGECVTRTNTSHFWLWDVTTCLIPLMVQKNEYQLPCEVGGGVGVVGGVAQSRASPHTPTVTGWERHGGRGDLGHITCWQEPVITHLSRTSQCPCREAGDSHPCAKEHGPAPSVPIPWWHRVWWGLQMSLQFLPSRNFQPTRVSPSVSWNDAKKSSWHWLSYGSNLLAVIGYQVLYRR